MPTRTPTFELIELHPRIESLEAEVLAGLARNPKVLPPKLFYDERGSDLFEQITRLEEYYLTRAEMEILEAKAEDVATIVGDGAAIIELGSGSSTKVRLFLSAIGGPITYVPIDISLDALREAALRIDADFPHVRVVAIHADYTQQFELPVGETWTRRVVFFPGSTIGNLQRPAAHALLDRISSALSPGDVMILGTDLVKDPAIFHAAYNDAQGVTAEFNLNILRRIRDELGGEVDIESFEHLAFYNNDLRRIEMHLRSLRDQTIVVRGQTFSFQAGETIHTENSHKYTLDDIRDLIANTRFVQGEVWFDSNHLFGVHLLRMV